MLSSSASRTLAVERAAESRARIPSSSVTPPPEAAIPSLSVRAATLSSCSRASLAMPSMRVCRSRCAAIAALSSSRRSEEHTSELQSLMRISYAVSCLKKKKHLKDSYQTTNTTHYTKINISEQLAYH